jgi:hypothetical protein
MVRLKRNLNSNLIIKGIHSNRILYTINATMHAAMNALHTHARTHTHICMYIYIYTHTHTHIHTHIYIYIH